MMFKGDNVKIYGSVEIGDGSIIEDNVIIGHPGKDEVAKILELDRIENYATPDALYNAASKTKTIIGKKAIIRSGTIIYSGVTIGDDFDCAHNVLIRENVSIGNNTYFKAFTHIMANVRIGDWCRISAIISDNSTVGNYCSIFGTLTHRSPKLYAHDKGPWIGPTIEDYTLIGRGAVILGPLTIGHGSKIGANMVVASDIAPQTIIKMSTGLPNTYVIEKHKR